MVNAKNRANLSIDYRFACVVVNLRGISVTIEPRVESQANVGFWLVIGRICHTAGNQIAHLTLVSRDNKNGIALADTKVKEIALRLVHQGLFSIGLGAHQGKIFR